MPARDAPPTHPMRSQRLAHAAKIEDFSAKDLYFPEPDRTRAVFSAFINFIKFTEQSEAFINRLRNQSTAVIKERQAVLEETAALEQQMSEFKYVTPLSPPRCPLADACRKGQTRRGRAKV